MIVNPPMMGAMVDDRDGDAAPGSTGGLDSATLRPTGALLAAQIAIGAALVKNRPGIPSVYRPIRVFHYTGPVFWTGPVFLIPGRYSGSVGIPGIPASKQ